MMDESKAKDFDPKSELLEKWYSKSFLRKYVTMEQCRIISNPGCGIQIIIDKVQ